MLARKYLPSPHIYQTLQQVVLLRIEPVGDNRLEPISEVSTARCRDFAAESEVKP